MMNGIETLARDFFENRNVCVTSVELSMNEECYAIDPQMIDTENDFYAIIPVVVVGIINSDRIPGRKYYQLRAQGSKMDDKLNILPDAPVAYYRVIENTSPYLIKVNDIVDFQNQQNNA